MIDKIALLDALTKAFIGYQHRLDCPMPIPHETEEMTILKYRTDPIFHAKVRALVSGVMQIVGEHLDGGHPMADKITTEQQPTACVGCEGVPVPENSPCAVCGQKPSPDVTLLVESLELFVSNPTPTSEDFDMARTALAAYRKQGGES